MPAEKTAILIVPISGSVQFSLTFSDKIERHDVYGGVYFTKGALTYSLGMKGVRTHYETETVNGTDFPSYRMMPDKDWNYAVTETAAPEFEAGKDTVWDLDAALPCIKVRARKVENWKIRPTDRFKCWTWRYEDVIKNKKHVFTPKLPNMKKAVLAEMEETIILYPYGASKVRMTVLPTMAKQRK